MGRQAVAIALPHTETVAVSGELAAAGFEPIAVGQPDQLEALLAKRPDVALAILDGESDFDVSLEYYALLHEPGRSIPALMVLSPRALDRLGGSATGASINDEYFARPYSAESLR